MWQLQKVADEGTTEPYIARLWSGAFELRDLLLRHLARGDQDFEVRRRHFDERYQPLLDALGAARRNGSRIRTLLQEHKSQVAAGTIVSRQRNALQINETIHAELQEQFGGFLSAAARATKVTQEVSTYLGINIGFLFQQPPKFQAGLAQLRASGDLELAEYLSRTRSGWSEVLIERRHSLEHKGWRLPDVRYIERPGGQVEVLEPEVDNQSVSEFATVMTSHLLGFVEDMLALAVQRGLAGTGDLIDTPIESRDPAHVRRFRLGVPALQPNDRFWRLRYSELGFYGS